MNLILSENKKGLVGLWVPIDLLGCKSLNRIEKELLLWIHYFHISVEEGCLKTDQELANISNLPEKHIDIYLNRFSKLNLIRIQYLKSGRRIRPLLNNLVRLENRIPKKELIDFKNNIEKVKALNNTLKKERKKVTKERNKKDKYILYILKYIYYIRILYNNILISNNNILLPTNTESISSSLSFSKNYEKIFNKKSKKEKEFSQEEELINYWNSLFYLTKHRKGTKTYEKAIKNLRSLQKGTFFKYKSLDKYFLERNKIPMEYRNKKFSLEEIKNGFDGINKLLNPQYLPKDKGSVAYARNINGFLYNSFTNNPNTKGTAMFLRCFYTSPRLIDSLQLKNPYPSLTDMLEKFLVNNWREFESDLETSSSFRNKLIVIVGDIVNRFKKLIVDSRKNKDCRTSCIQYAYCNNTSVEFQFWFEYNSRDSSKLPGRPELFLRKYLSFLEDNCHKRFMLKDIKVGSFEWKNFCDYMKDHGRICMDNIK